MHRKDREMTIRLMVGPLLTITQTSQLVNPLVQAHRIRWYLMCSGRKLLASLSKKTEYRVIVFGFAGDGPHFHACYSWNQVQRWQLKRASAQNIASPFQGLASFPLTSHRLGSACSFHRRTIRALAYGTAAGGSSRRPRWTLLAI